MMFVLLACFLIQSQGCSAHTTEGLLKEAEMKLHIAQSQHSKLFAMDAKAYKIKEQVAGMVESNSTSSSRVKRLMSSVTLSRRKAAQVIFANSMLSIQQAMEAIITYADTILIPAAKRVNKDRLNQLLFAFLREKESLRVACKDLKDVFHEVSQVRNVHKDALLSMGLLFHVNTQKEATHNLRESEARVLAQSRVLLSRFHDLASVLGLVRETKNIASL